MNITSAKYCKNPYTNENVTVKTTIDGQEMYVPIDNDNRHYQAILVWAEEDGNEIAEAD
tara:strand:- start:281 stop:457 length:177 start_codon:yes stop_codon:yes gene_type:complete